MVTLDRIDPATGALVATFSVTHDPRIAEEADGTIWLWARGERVVRRIDPATNGELSRFEVPEGTADIFIENDIGWLTDSSASELWRIDLGG